MWSEITAWLSGIQIGNWPAVMDAVDEWVYPGRIPSALSTDQYAVFEETVKIVLHDLSRLAEGRPGVLSTIRERASHSGFPFVVDIDPDYAVLFPDDPGDDERGYEVRNNEQADAVRRLMSDWLLRSPTEGARKLVWCVRESKAARRQWPDLSQWMCSLLAGQAADPGAWLTALMAEDASADHLLPFLDCIVRQQQEGWLDCVIRCLRSPSLAVAALTVLISLPDQNDDLEREINEKLKAWPKLVEREAMFGRIPSPRLLRLLNDDDIGVLSATAEGIWHGRSEHPIPSELLVSWRRAVVRGGMSEHDLVAMFSADTDLAFEWLVDRANRKPTRYRHEDDAITAAANALSADQRSVILRQSAFQAYDNQHFRLTMEHESLPLLLARMSNYIARFSMIRAVWGCTWLRYGVNHLKRGRVLLWQLLT